jgi:ribosome biogenesis GTPase / thiamine phosphate phosphatase
MKQTGLVVASHGRHCVVETPDGERRICHPRGKKSQVVVGDRVQWLASTDEGTIEKVEPRHNLFYRQDEIRTKSFAANLDQVLILLAAEPEFSEMQLTRALIAAEAEHITPLIVLNKRDLTELHARAFARLEPYVKMGYTVLQGAFKSGDLGDLPERLKHKTTLVLGPSGTGKSTLINALVPNANVATAEISQALNSGKHTTTSTTWHWVDAERKTGLIDSPGFQEFGVHHIDAMQLAAYMPDFKPHVTNCKFYNCTHLHEPSCGVQDAVETGAISPSRYKLYGMLFAELTQPMNY